MTKYKVVERVGTKYLNYNKLEEGEMMLLNPSKFIEYVEKNAQTKKGKNFISKSYIFKDLVNNDRVAVPHCGLLEYFMQEYNEGAVLQLRYDGKDEEGRHQVALFECIEEGENQGELKGVCDDLDDL